MSKHIKRCLPAIMAILALAWFTSGKPMLGVCLGAQLANVVRGGSLVQDIPSQVHAPTLHSQEKTWAHHTIRLADGGRLRALFQADTLDVNSSHHQAVKRLGAGLRPVAWASDGVIEATERTDGPFGLFVQWHPEAMPPEHRDIIFQAFINACR